MELEVSLTELEPNSDEYIICLEDIFLIEQKSAIVSDILFVELLQKYAEMDVGENYSIRYITEWRVIRVPDTPPEEDTDADEIPQYYN
jgi:hypothetical protein